MGPVTIQVVQDLMRGPGLRGGPDSPGGPEPQLLALERLPLPGHVATPDLPQSWNGTGLLSGEQDFGPQGSSYLDVVKDNYKGPCLDTARGGTPVLGYRQWPPGPSRERHEPPGGAITVMCSYTTWLRWCALGESDHPGPLRPVCPLPGFRTRALSMGRRRCRLRVWNQAKRLHRLRIARGASTTSRTWLLTTVASGLRRSGPPEWTWSDRGERSPPERATGVDLERPWRAVSAGAGHRSGLGTTVASGLRRSGPPEWTWSDRGERSPPERATGV